MTENSDYYYKLFKQNSPSEGSVFCDAAMKVMKQNEKAKTYPWTLRAHIPVQPRNQPKKHWNINVKEQFSVI